MQISMGGYAPLQVLSRVRKADQGVPYMLQSMNCKECKSHS